MIISALPSGTWANTSAPICSRGRASLWLHSLGWPRYSGSLVFVEEIGFVLLKSLPLGPAKKKIATIGFYLTF
jgi:hypothetical protein